MAEGIYGKKCPKCGHINDEFAMVCANGCVGGLSRISAQYHKPEEVETSVSESAELQPKLTTPQQDKATISIATPFPKLHCESEPNFIVEIKNGYVIGREGEINVTSLPRSEYISRKHATFIQQGNNWFLRVESKTNPTIINSRSLNPCDIELLNDNDRITLADTTFIFRRSPA